MRSRMLYLKSVAATATAVVVMAGGLNLVVDPYGTFRLYENPRFNRIKPYPEHDITTVKSHALRHVRPDALILGNSRSEVGFDPTHPAWQKYGYRSVYNAAIPGSDINTAWKQLQQASAIQAPGIILLGLEFFDFLVSPEKPITPASESPKNRESDIIWQTRATLTMQAVMDSLTTLRIQFQRNPSQLTYRGFNPLLEYIDQARIDGYYTLFRQRAEENVKNHGRRPANLFAQGTRSSNEFERLRQMVRWSIQHDCDLRLVIYPYHAQLLLIVDELGLWPLFDEWKRQVVRIINEETASNPERSKVTLLDFSGFSTFSQEPIPEKGDRKSIVKWYWEAGHFKKELGDLVIARSFKQENADSLQDFGVSLTAQNLEAHLQHVQEDKTFFRAANPNSVREVADLVRKLHKSVRQ